MPGGKDCCDGATAHTIARDGCQMERGRAFEEMAQPFLDRAIRGANDRGRIDPSHRRNKRPCGTHSSFIPGGTIDDGRGHYRVLRTISSGTKLHAAFFGVCSELHRVVKY